MPELGRRYNCLDMPVLLATQVRLVVLHTYIAGWYTVCPLLSSLALSLYGCEHLDLIAIANSLCIKSDL